MDRKTQWRAVWGKAGSGVNSLAGPLECLHLLEPSTATAEHSALHGNSHSSFPSPAGPSSSLYSVRLRHQAQGSYLCTDIRKYQGQSEEHRVPELGTLLLPSVGMPKGLKEHIHTLLHWQRPSLLPEEPKVYREEHRP